MGQDGRRHITAGYGLWNGQRHGLIFEPTFAERTESSTMAFHRKLILLFTSDTELFGQIFSGSSHHLPAHRIGEPFPETVAEFRMTEPFSPSHIPIDIRRPAHALH